MAVNLIFKINNLFDIFSESRMQQTNTSKDLDDELIQKKCQ
jgi:hypothetical protein